MPPPYVPVEGRPWRLTMGLRRLDPAHWLEVDGRRRHDLLEKAALLADPRTHRRVVATRTAADDAAAELLALVIDHLATEHPGLVEAVNGCLLDRRTGTVVDPGALHPVDAAGRLVQEDLCVMVRGDGGWMLGAASVCFPSRWDLAAKVGRDLRAIHAPVPGYAAALAEPVDGFFDRIDTGRPVWRLNWTLVDEPALHQPGPAAAVRERGSTGDVGTRVWFRVERQTLRRLPVSGAVVFTIRTYVTALADLVERHPEVVDAFRRALADVPEATVAYKGWARLLPEVLEWLGTAAPAGAR